MSIEEVRALVAERQRYDDWIQALEARRSETPARVFERVHGDYQGRRSDVLVKLRSHFDGLSELSTQLDQRLASLEETLSSLEDERAEAMLRTAVGEFDDERWEEVRAAVEERISSLGEEREALLTEVDEVRTLLASARTDSDQSGAGLDSSLAATAQENHVADEEIDLGSTEPVVLFDTPETVSLHPIPEAQINLVAELPPRAETPVVPSDAVELASADLPEADYEDALALFEEPAKPADAGFLNSLDGIESEFDIPDVASDVFPSVETSRSADSGLNAGSGAGSASASSPAADPFDDLAFLRSVIEPDGGISSGAGSVPPVSSSSPISGSTQPTASSSSEGQQKTLRCTECGTMNLPTEWYCERCGGELAAF